MDDTARAGATVDAVADRLGSSAKRTAPLRLLGALACIAGGLGVVYFAAVFDISVEVPSHTIGDRQFGGGRIVNLELMQDRQTGLFVAGLGLVIGIVLLLAATFGGRANAMGQAPSDARSGFALGPRVKKGALAALVVAVIIALGAGVFEYVSRELAMREIEARRLQSEADERASEASIKARQALAPAERPPTLAQPKPSAK